MVRFRNQVPQLQVISVNELHDEALIQAFEKGIGNKTLIITPSFPFIFIGKIQEVIEDHVVIEVDVTLFSELESRLWNVHIHQVEVFYIESDGKPLIPEMHDYV